MGHSKAIAGGAERAPLELIRSAQAGDRAAFAQIAREFRDRALGAAYRRLRDRELAEEVAQEALLQAYTAIDQLRSPAAFGPWLNSIITSKARQLRPSVISSAVADDALHHVPDGRSPAVDELFERKLVRGGVRASLLRLPEHQRGVIRMFYFHDLGHAHICDALGLPLTTIKKRLHDARLRLRRHIGATDRLTDPRHHSRVTAHRGIPFLEEEKMGIEANKAIIKEYHRHAVAGRLDEVRAMYREDAVHHGPAGARPAAASALSNIERHLSSGADFQIADMMAEGDRVALWLVNRGTPTNQDVLVMVFRLADGKIVETTNTVAHYLGAA